MSCSHADYNFPMRLKGETGPHVTCQKCKQRVPYDWEQMKIQKVKKLRLQGVKECVRGAE